MADKIDIQKTATEISEVINSGNLQSATVRLSSEYIRMQPDEFKELVSQMTDCDSNKQKVYLDGKNLMVDNCTWRVPDSTIFQMPVKPVDPSSTAAEKFLNLCAPAPTTFTFDQGGQRNKLAMLGLIGLYNTLPKSEGKRMMNDAEDLYNGYKYTQTGEEYKSTGRPSLTMKFRDLDKDGIDELADVRLASGFNRGRYEKSAVVWDLFDPPKSISLPVTEQRPESEPNVKQNPSRASEMVRERKTP